MSEAGVMEVSPTFEEYVATRGRALWKSAWLLTGDAQRAEDLVQTALVKCWRRWDKIAADGSVDGYVRRTWSRPSPTGAAAAHVGRAGLAAAARRPDRPGQFRTRACR